MNIQRSIKGSWLQPMPRGSESIQHRCQKGRSSFHRTIPQHILSQMIRMTSIGWRRLGSQKNQRPQPLMSTAVALDVAVVAEAHVPAPAAGGPLTALELRKDPAP